VGLSIEILGFCLVLYNIFIDFRIFADSQQGGICVLYLLLDLMGGGVGRDAWIADNAGLTGSLLRWRGALSDQVFRREKGPGKKER